MLTGGGTLGPVTPLLAVAEAWKKIDPEVAFVWVGTRFGPERELIEEAGIPFLHIPTVRFPRYPTIEWVSLPFSMSAATVMAWLILGREKPDLIASAGGYTGVPFIITGWLRRIPSWVHQQDTGVTLANRMTAWMARCVTVAWEFLQRSFSPGKTDWIGNPVRESIKHGKRDKAYERFGLDLSKPTVMVFGGGTGAVWINTTMEAIGAELAMEANVIHITGPEKRTELLTNIGSRYTAVELLNREDMAHAYAAADVVVARAGMATITELAALKKAAVLIPLPNTVQVLNAEILLEARAAVVCDQTVIGAGDIKLAVLALLADPDRRKLLGERMAEVLPTDVAGKMAEHVAEHCGLKN